MNVGLWNQLIVVRRSPHGLYLTDGEADVLLPTKVSPAEAQIGDTLNVFVYTDSEDRPVATTKRPRATVGEFAKLRVVSVGSAGAFLDWGLDKDLLCPASQQPNRLQPDDEVLVRVYLDERTNRVAASAKLAPFLVGTDPDLRVGQSVSILVYAFREDGASVIVDGRVAGSIFNDELVEKLRIGDQRTGYVKRVRETDGKVAISLRPQTFGAILDHRERILEALNTHGGFLPLSDRSDPAEIQAKLGLSKGAFKKLIGVMYREGLLTIEPLGIRQRKEE